MYVETIQHATLGKAFGLARGKHADANSLQCLTLQETTVQRYEHNLERPNIFSEILAFLPSHAPQAGLQVEQTYSHVRSP